MIGCNVSTVQTGAYGHHSLRLHIGLADASRIDSLIVQWPSGIITEQTNLAPNQRLRIHETTTR